MQGKVWRAGKQNGDDQDSAAPSARVRGRGGHVPGRAPGVRQGVSPYSNDPMDNLITLGCVPRHTLQDC